MHPISLMSVHVNKQFGGGGVLMSRVKYKKWRSLAENSLPVTVSNLRVKGRYRHMVGGGSLYATCPF